MNRGIGTGGIAGFVVVALAIAWAAGRLDQRLFDDEILTLAMVGQRSYGELVSFYLMGSDVHPPLSFLWFRLLHDLSTPIWLQRALSFALAAGGFALILDLVWRRLPGTATASRVLAVILFLGAPLLFGMGAALRWYPLLVLPVALAVWSVLNQGRPTVLAGFSFGLAACVSFLAAIPALAYLVWRYMFQRRFDLASDGPFLAVALILGIPGLIAFGLSVENLAGQADGNPLIALGMTLLGVIGGYGLGLSQGLVALPLVVLLLAGITAGAIVRRRLSDDLLGISLLIGFLCLLLTATGFAKPRSFLFALPFLAAATVLGGFSLSWRLSHAVATAIAALVVSVTAIWLMNGNDRPFKRNLYVPDAAVLGVVRAQAARETSLIVSSEPGLAWQLHKEGYCVYPVSFWTGCDRRTALTVVMIDDGTFTQRPGPSAAGGAITLEHRLAHQQVFGDDEDAPTKQFLASRHVPKWLVSVAIYRRN